MLYVEVYRFYLWLLSFLTDEISKFFKGPKLEIDADDLGRGGCFCETGFSFNGDGLGDPCWRLVWEGDAVVDELIRVDVDILVWDVALFSIGNVGGDKC